METQIEIYFTIHLGDVYYVGDPPEVNENFLGIANLDKITRRVSWPIGKVGSFALKATMKSCNGTGYFDMMLPNLGSRQQNCTMSGRKPVSLCLQNKYWRLIAIDTGYNSIGFPILSHIPWINSIPGIGGDCKLRDELISWLESIVNPQQDNPGLVILAHHQYYSGFDTRYRKPAQQLGKAGVKRQAIWFWGHEHRMAGYDLYGSDDLKVFGRCMGTEACP